MTESLRLLMVEDQEELRELIGEALRDAGISVDTADDGHSALRMVRDSGPYDVVFSDIRPSQRGHRIVAEVVVIALEHRFQQHAQFQVEQLYRVHCREHHTRQSETSLSTSMGLAM